MSEQLLIIDDLKDLDQVTEYLKDKEFVSFDTETSGLDKDAKIIGWSVAAENDLGIYVLLGKYNKEKGSLDWQSQDFMSKSSEILRSLLTKNLIMHNAIFDVEKVVDNFGINLMPALHTDTMILAHLINENRRIGLKDLCAEIFGEDAKNEQAEMLASIEANGGVANKTNFELYKADPYVIGRYAAKDAILTLNLFYHLVPQLIEQGLDKFFYEDESMPLLKGPTYELNTIGLRVDIKKLEELEDSLEKEVTKLRADIMEAIYPLVRIKYPGDKPSNTFNIDSNQQLAWLLFIVMRIEFNLLTDKGQDVAKEIIGRIPYTSAQKHLFIQMLQQADKSPEKYLKCDRATLQDIQAEVSWVKLLLQYKKAEKLLTTYVGGIKERVRYGIIRPSFRQAGTRGTRMSSQNPNFQNLPRDDKRIKSCIIARPGKVFVGADYSQLEPRVFTAISQDKNLLEAYAKNEDFYSVVGIQVFNKPECSADKEADNYLGKAHPQIRQMAKVIALSIPYGTGAGKLSSTLWKDMRMSFTNSECQEIIDDYFHRLQGVAKMVKDSHEQAMTTGVVYNLFGRPRRIPEAMRAAHYKNMSVRELPYDLRNFLNLAVNAPIQNTAGSILNRSCIALLQKFKAASIKEAHIVMGVHDEVIVECNQEDGELVASLLKDAMENTVKLDGVALIAEPKIAYNLGDLK